MSNAEQELITALLSTEVAQRKQAARAIKNAVIGSQLRKSRYVEVGIAPALSQLLKHETDKAVLIEASAVVGSFAHGNPAHAAAICTTEIVTQFLLKLNDGDVVLVESCIRTLKTLIKTGFVDPTAVQNVLGEDLASMLVKLVEAPLNIALYATAIIGRCCVTEQLKRWVVQRGGIVALVSLLDRTQNSESTDSIMTVLEALETLTEGPGAALCVASLELVTFPVKPTRGRTPIPFQQHLCRLLHHQSPPTRLLVARCLSNILHENTDVVVASARDWTSPQSVPEKVLGAIIRLLKEPHTDVDTQIATMKVLAKLTKNHESLQQSAAENNGVALLTKHFVVDSAKNNGLLQASLMAMAAICSKSDSARKQVVKLGVKWESVVSCLQHDSVALRLAAAACILSISRSVGTLRTTLVESGVAKPLCNMFEDPDMTVRCTAVAAICNLVMEFSPVKKLAMDLGVIGKLVNGTFSTHEELRLNCVWGLKNLLFEADSPDASVIKSRVMDALTWSQLWKLVNDESASVQEQAIGALRNLVYGSETDIAQAFRACGGATLFFEMLERQIAVCNGRCVEQLLFVLCNVTAGTAVEHKEQILARGELITLVVSSLTHPFARVKVAALWCIINLTAPEISGSKLRQNELMKHDILTIIASLSTMGDLDVKDRSRTVEEQFAFHGFNFGDADISNFHAASSSKQSEDAMDTDN
eukprot:m.186001 g.186001  ORF g.186001 m.186001 type:complete len:703 (+) comp32249_c1_seq1:236-2344(+)